MCAFCSCGVMQSGRERERRSGVESEKEHSIANSEYCESAQPTEVDETQH